MRARSLIPLLFSLCAIAAGCRDQKLSHVVGEVAVSPARIEFPRAFVGFPVEQTLTLSNRSRATRTVQLEVAPPFELVDGRELTLHGGASSTVHLRFAPDREGAFEGSLRVTVESDELKVPLVANAETAPDCQPSSPCRQTAFDPVSGSCVEAALAEGAECTPESACIVNAHCIHDACIGEALSCDDGNVCTIDACEPTSGCVHHEPEDACAAPSDPCKVAYCDPVLGCSTTDAVDGTACGDADCETAQVCIGGTCKTAAVPEGAVCAKATPCQSAGICHDNVCVQGPSGTMTAAWTYAAPPQNSIQMWLVFLGVADAAENLYWGECRTTNCNGPGCPSACDLVSATRDGAIRWRVAALPTSDLGLQTPTHQLVAGSTLITLLGGSIVEARSLSDGALLWSHDFTTEFWHSIYDTVNGKKVNGMILSVPSADATQVVVPFAGFVTGAESTELADSFAVAFDLQTGATNWQVTLRGEATSSAIDEQGNFYVSSRLRDERGAVVAYKLESWTRQGTERWIQNSGRLGDLAVADGLVLVDGLEAFDAANGAARWSIPGISSTALISGGAAWFQSRTSSGSTLVVLSKVDAATGSSTWDYRVPNDSRSPIGLSLTKDASALMLLQRASPPSTSWAWHLDEVTASGEAGFSCALPNSAYVIGYSVLLDQRLVVQVLENGERKLMAFDVPGQQLAKSGWVAPRADKTSSGGAH